LRKETIGAPRRLTADAIMRIRATHWPQGVTPIAQLMVRVHRFSNLIHENVRRETAALGLAFTEFEVLVTLRSAAPPHELNPTDLYGALLISSGGLTKVLRGLEQRKLITRARGADGRVKPVRLTPKGRALAERVLKNVVRSDGALIAGALSAREIEEMTGMLRKVLGVLEAET